MLLLSTLCIPFIAAIILLFVKHNEKANYVAIACSGVTMALAFNIAFNGATSFDANWILSINARFLCCEIYFSTCRVLLTKALRSFNSPCYTRLPCL